jgi:ATP-binding cassette subfamily C protein
MSEPAKRSAIAAPSPLAAALRSCRAAFGAIGLFTAIINILMLTGSMFMLQVYDRVLPSRSVPTLIALVALVGGLYAIQGVLDAVRGRMLVRIARSLDERLSVQVYEAVVRLPLKAPSRGDGLQAMRDLDQLRSFLSSTGPGALFDLPWMPLYLGICFAFHVWIGITALAGALVLVLLTLMTEFFTRAPAKASAGFGAGRLSLAEAGRRNAEVLQAMGMTKRLAARWNASNIKYMDEQQRTSDLAGGIGAASRVLRMLLQSCVLAVGAYLVINQEATAGIIIASSILVSRALAPVELSIANWKGFQAARQSWRRLSDLIALWPVQAEPMALPAPRANLAVEGLTVAPPGVQRVVAQDISFQLNAGQGLGIIGPSAAGKTSLARALVGVWQPARGKVRLDGAALEQWAAEALGSHIGYLPQDVELLDGTIAENIARFSAEIDSEKVVAAARSAGVHDLILRLPDGYETKIGESGSALSAGQRQRVALARALYGEPFLVVLDEPNSNLDAEGDQALASAILDVRNRGGIVIVVAHRPAALQNVDMALAMANGRVQSFGPKDEVLHKVLDATRAPARPIKLVADADGSPR